MQTRRDESLDALRGLAVLGMALSGSLAFGDSLPGWMFHAQVPPPLHRFDPARAGISWVDLVFPFFLFSMGAALPLALRTAGRAALVWTALRRFGLLLYFALFTQHMKAWVIAATPDWRSQCLSLAAFLLLGLQLGPARPALKALAWLAAVALLFGLPFADGRGFSAGRSDIILLVLANMALFGTLLYGFTRHAPLLRLAVLPLLAAVLLAGSVPGSWTQGLLNFTPGPWAYKLYYLKYLFIIVPGLFAGEWLRCFPTPPAGNALTGWLALGLIVGNVSLLYARELELNLGLSLMLLAALYWRVRRDGDALAQRFVAAGAGLLLLGLACEPLQGGIHKDPSTFSYYFVCSGLAFLAMLVLRAMAAHSAGKRLQRYLAEHGRNPLLAYVAGALLVLPLLRLTGLHEAWSSLQGSVGLGLLKGLLFTAAVSLLTLFCNRKGWLWKS
ncbi:DUF5009 domain-containing protein [Paucibacter sp. JuS9]|uniref:DUF5009 domain-containing protein n=1 Tax=Paucibacter sp. JuS9 TaxID=3228748 RepID=UPI0037581550